MHGELACQRGAREERLAADGLQRYIAEAEATLADEGDPWIAFADFMRRIVDADTHSLVQRLAGTFSPSAELFREAARSHELAQRIVERAVSAGVVRGDLATDDLSLLFEQLAAIRIGDARRTSELRHRYLALFLDGLRDHSAAPLPGPAPAADELNERWVR
jgi:hypothetical protein